MLISSVNDLPLPPSFLIAGSTPDMLHVLPVCLNPSLFKNSKLVGPKVLQAVKFIFKDMPVAKGDLEGLIESSFEPQTILLNLNFLSSMSCHSDINTCVSMVTDTFLTIFCHC